MRVSRPHPHDGLCSVEGDGCLPGSSYAGLAAASGRTAPTLATSLPALIISTIRTREVTSKNQHPARSRADQRVSIPLTNQICGIDRLRAVLEVACTIADDLVPTQVLRIGDVAFAGRGDHARMPA